ncbi:Rtl10 [Phodopus roborovskii]|uniref:Rtl10 protein n=1 Tax=Phodopus roborovskii TaxID=109678 RepID=A0AAU9ZHL4_PHORO|nr:Rtl10 [Phodopus roborovskii]
MAVCHPLFSCCCVVPASSVCTRPRVGPFSLYSWHASWQFHQCTPLAADGWPCCGNPMCVYTTMNQNNTANDSSGSKPTEGGPPAGRIPDPWPLRTYFPWVPGFNL